MTGAAGTRSSPGPWIQSPAWDGLWIFSATWAPAIAVMLFLVARAAVGDTVTLAAPGFNVTTIAVIYLPLSILHRITTTYAVLGTPILRAEIAKDRARYLYVPAGIVAGCILLSLAFAFHDLFAFMPTTHGRLWAFFLLAYVMILWERWHFCAQEFGVLSIYRIRAGQRAPEDKRFDRIYTVVLMLGVTMALYVCLGFEDERNVLLYGTPLAGYDGALLNEVARVACVIGAVTTAVALWREARHPKRSLPKTLFYAQVGAHTIILYFFPKVLGLYFLSNVVHHWMVSVGLFGRVTINAYTAELGSTWAALKTLLLRVGPLLALAVAFYLFFGTLDRAGNLSPVPTELAFLGSSVAAKVLAGVVIGLFFALNYLHYYYDRCFYAFSSEAVRKTVGVHLFGSPSPASPAPQPSASQPAAVS